MIPVFPDTKDRSMWAPERSAVSKAHQVREL
jgi:hypothetical protein